MLFGKFMSRKRGERELTFRKLQELTGVDHVRLHRIEKAIVQARTFELDAIAIAFGYSSRGAMIRAAQNSKKR